MLFSGLLSFQSSKANPYNQSLANAYVWLIGSATGRLFAIVRDSNNEGKILWKRSLMSPGTIGSRTTLKWERLSFEGGHTGSYHPHVITSLQMVRAFNLPLVHQVNHVSSSGWKPNDVYDRIDGWQNLESNHNHGGFFICP
jgi:hypothetical protein